MSVKIPLTLLAAISVSLAGSVSAAAEQEKIDAFRCKDLMRSSDSDRQNTIAYLHGYFNGKAGVTAINVDEMAKQTDALIERCLDNPSEEAMKAMESVRK